MADLGNRPPGRTELLDIIAHVRRRWRLKLALRGAATAAALTAGAFMVAAFGLEALKFSPAAIIAFRIMTLAVLAIVAIWFLVRPLARRVTDEQVALYLEEHEPSLDAAIVSAIDANAASSADAGDRGDRDRERSPALVRRLVETAIERCEAVDAGRRVEQPHLRRYSVVLAVIIAIVGLTFLFGPSYLRHGASALLRVSQNVEAASPYRIDVRPGDATVPRGSDQTIAATLVGFESDRVELLVRKPGGASF
jgi:hypothetical protein